MQRTDSGWFWTMSVATPIRFRSAARSAVLLFPSSDKGGSLPSGGSTIIDVRVFKANTTKMPATASDAKNRRVISKNLLVSFWIRSDDIERCHGPLVNTIHHCSGGHPLQLYSGNLQFAFSDENLIIDGHRCIVDEIP